MEAFGLTFLGASAVSPGDTFCLRSGGISPDVREVMNGELDAKLNGSEEMLEQFYDRIKQFVVEIQNINSEESNTVVIVVSRDHVCFIEQLISKQNEEKNHTYTNGQKNAKNLKIYYYVTIILSQTIPNLFLCDMQMIDYF